MPNRLISCPDCAAVLAEESEAERPAHMHAAIALGEALLEALEDYADDHEDLTYRQIFEALAYMHWKLERDLDEDEDET